jgi:predicted protein tyrosine phosphatase
MKVLFVCSRNRRRSPTAEAVFGRYLSVEALSAGTSPDAETPVSADLIEWADLVIAMESVHRRRLRDRFGPLLKTKKIVVLGIPDNYEYMDPELMRILEDKVHPHLRDREAEKN